MGLPQGNQAQRMTIQGEIFERIKANVELKCKRRNIICPYCDCQQDNDTTYGHVSYWGEEPSFDCQCQRCEKKFIVKEEVEREFICTKMGDLNEE